MIIIKLKFVYNVTNNNNIIVIWNKKFLKQNFKNKLNLELKNI